MKRLMLSISLVAGLLIAATPALAGGGPNVKGSGWAQNDNSGVGPASQLTKFGISAKATGPGSGQYHTVFTGTWITVYPASGTVGVKNVEAADISNILYELKGHVVCIADLGPASGVDGINGGPANPSQTVWEIRAAFEDPGSGSTFYGSYFLQDDGASDYEDENFEGALLGDPSCGNASQFALESVVDGKVAVK